MGTTASAQELLTQERAGAVQRSTNQQRSRGPTSFDDVPNIVVGSTMLDSPPHSSQSGHKLLNPETVRKRQKIVMDDLEPGPSTRPDDLHRRHSPGQYNEDEIVFETFHYKDGVSYTCLYRAGERFYMDPETNGPWLPFPETWYGNGVIETDGVVREEDNPGLVNEVMTQLAYGSSDWDAMKETESTANTDSDDRSGSVKHPYKGTVYTYIFEEQRNVHCFFDESSGKWVKLPLSLELQCENIQGMISEVQQLVPDWTDKSDILAALRASDYDVKDCVMNMQYIGYNSAPGFGASSNSRLLEEKDRKIQYLELQLKEARTNYDNAVQHLAKLNNAETVSARHVQALEDKVAQLEVSARASHLQANSLSQGRNTRDDGRPKSSVPKQSLKSLSQQVHAVNQSYHRLRLHVEQSFTDFGATIKKVADAVLKLPKFSSLVSAHEFEEVKALYRKECLQRKLLYNKLQELRGNIRVYARCRRDSAVKCALEFPNEEELVLRDVRGNKQTFKFDRVYNPDTTQEQVFEETRPIVTSCVDGYNVCIIAYGQTGAGKTFTMMGPSDNRGVNIRAIQELLKITSERESINYQLSVSMVEIYNEIIHDLLTTDCKVVTAQHVGSSVTIQGLSSHPVRTEADITELMNAGATNRTVASTKMNSESSRSHLMVILTVEGHDSTSNARTTATLTLVDLAGSERIAKTEASGQQLVEAAAINRSLSSLGQVFAALGKSALHVPFRNSKLTQVLQPSLSGDAKAALFLAVSPAESNLTETISTLTFGSNAKHVELGPPKRNISKFKKL